MVRDVRKWVKKCLACIKRKVSEPHHGEMHIRLHQAPWETEGIDLIGPFPETVGTYYKYVLTVVDFFTHYTITVPLPNKAAKTVAKALFNHVLAVHGCPKRLMSDRGSEFLNAVITELTEILSIKEVYTSAYRPLANGATERVHRFLNDSISMYVTKFARKCDLWLQAATFVHNTSVISGTDQLTPFYLVYGRNAVMPNDVAFAPFFSLPRDQLTYAQELTMRLSKARDIFSSVTKELKQQRKEYYDLGRKVQTFPVGDYVLVRRPPRLNKGNNELAIKWLPKWDGPYRITAKVKDSVNYRLEHAYTGKHLDPTNVDKLIRVQPWALDNQDRAHAINNPDVDQDDQTQEPDRTPNQAPNIAFEPEYSVGDFLVFEQAGTDNLIDDDVRTMIRLLFDWLYTLTGKQASTSEACKHLYNQNADYKKILISIGGIRKLLYYTASIEFVIEQATGGNNFLRIVGNGNAPLFNSDRSGGKYAIGQVSFTPSDDDAYEVLLYDRKSKKSSWDKPLKPVVIEGQKQIRVVPPDLIKCKISLHNNKISREGIATLENFQLLLVYFSIQI